MRRAPRTAVGCVLLALAGMAACGNAPVTISISGNTNGVFAHKIVVGSLSSQTGPLPADFAPVVSGVQVYLDMVNAHGGVFGRKIDLAYNLDDGSDPSFDSSQARTLVDQDHVFAVVGVATPSFTGARFLASQSVPTFGLNINPNSAWLAGPTMFGNTGSYTDFSAPQLQTAFLAELHHVHAVAVLSYGVAQSQQGCGGVFSAFTQYQIPVAYRDTNIPAPVADLHADVDRMKAAGVDMVVSCMDLDGNVLLAQTMQQGEMRGVTQLWFDGYDESAVQQFASAMEGTYFLLQHVPFEVSDLDPGRYPGMDQFQATLRRYAPGTLPSEAALAGWTSADLFVTGLRAIGRDVSRSRLVAAINRLTSFTADDILAPVDWRTGHQAVTGPTNCTAFVVVHGALCARLRHSAERVELLPRAAPGGSADQPGRPPAAGGPPLSAALPGSGR